MGRYELDNAWDHAQRRLALLEDYLDPVTFRRIAGLGLRHGWRCLEVGAGGGSVARWLCGQVGTTGHVTATDLNTRFLDDINAANLTVQRHDIVAEPLPEAQFDLVHVRWLLHHLPRREEILPKLAAAVRPGGWLLIEDVDFFPIQASASRLYVEFMLALTETVVLDAGGDRYWSRKLPALVTELGLTDIGADADIPVLRGGGPVAKFFQLTSEQVRDKLLARGFLTQDQFEAGQALLDDPSLWGFAGAGLGVWGRRP